ncbi:MAG: glycosyl transferase family 9 [Gemmatimonadetes bacterium]|nr:glycosyl transferase family 9 [Gemmatimonadota bacterium]
MRIAVIRALHLGDMLCAVPALRALRAGFPRAEITLVGLPWARELVAHLHRYVDVFEEFPGFPGLPERDVHPARIVGFLDRMQRRPFDIVIQLHGSGAHVNELVALLGARWIAAFYRGDDVVSGGGLFVPWPESGTEIERLLALPRALGCPDTGVALELEVTAAHRARLRATEASLYLGAQPYVCIHPGARFPSRRWSPERFAAVGDALAERGYTVVLTGVAAEGGETAAVRHRMRAAAVDLTGALSLGAFAALIKDAALVVCNDTGTSHVAAAVGTRSVVVASGSDVARWAPVDASRHRVLWHDVPCRPCMHVTCPFGHECAAGVSVGDVLHAADSVLHSELAHA